MQSIKSTYNLTESVNVLKFLYGLSSFSLSLEKFNEIVSSSQTKQNLPLIFMALQQPIPNVNPTVLHKFLVHNLQRATATCFSTAIASQWIVFWQTNWGPKRPQMCSNVSLLILKCSCQKWSWYQSTMSCLNQNCAHG